MNTVALVKHLLMCSVQVVAAGHHRHHYHHLHYHYHYHHHHHQDAQTFIKLPRHVPPLAPALGC